MREVKARRSLEALRLSALEQMRQKSEALSSERQRKAQKEAIETSEANARQQELLQSLKEQVKQKAKKMQVIKPTVHIFELTNLTMKH